MYLSIFSDDQVTENKGGNLGKFSSRVEYHSLSELAYYLMHSASVVGTFREDYRCHSNLEAMYCLWMDFDKGKDDFNKVHEVLVRDNYNHLIMASKNHMKDKPNEGVCQRFHVYIPLLKPVRYVEDYKFLIDQVSGWYGWNIDINSRKPGQYAGKHPSLLAGSAKLKNLDHVPFLMMRKPKPIRKEYKDSQFKRELFVKYQLPLLMSLSEQGNRNMSVCKVCGLVAKYGGNADDAASLVREYYTGTRTELQCELKAVKSFKYQQ